MSTIITSVDRHSPAERAGIAAGEQLLTINGHEIIDVLDYRFYGYDTDCRLELREPAGTVRTVSLRKPEGRDLGLNFDTVLMDDMRCKDCTRYDSGHPCHLNECIWLIAEHNIAPSLLIQKPGCHIPQGLLNRARLICKAFRRSSMAEAAV